MTTIVIIADPDNIRYLDNCIKSLDENHDHYYNHILIIGNGIEELKYPDIDIVIDKRSPYGYILNLPKVKEAIGDNDVLLLDPRMRPLQDAINKLSNYALAFNNIGITCASNFNTDKPIKVLVPTEGAVFIKHKVLETIGWFDPIFRTSNAILMDLAFRATLKDYITVTNTGATFIKSIGSSRIKNPEDVDKDNETLKAKWGMNYFNTTGNPFIVKAISAIEKDKSKPISVLEVGCDLCATLLDIKNLFHNATIYGTDINSTSINIAKHIAECHYGNIEDYNLPYDANTFDYIIFGDVLEHLRDPKNVLLYCSRFLKDNGKLISSIPNLMNISVIKDLIVNGNFTYTDRGLLDKTHIHLFTEKEIKRTFTEAGYNIDSIQSLSGGVSGEDRLLINSLVALGGKDVTANMYTTFQYLVTASKM